MSDYITPQSASEPIKPVPDYSNDEQYHKLAEKLQLFRASIAKSPFFEESKQIITANCSQIRCIALGSPSQSNNALYQLAYLDELAKHIGARDISVYDPVFTPVDMYLLQQLNYTVEIEYSHINSGDTLYFMPHAPLELTNVVIINEKPQYLLANNIINHTDRYTKLKLHQTYPIIALLVKLTESDQNNHANADGFSQAKKRKNKLRFNQANIEYDFDSPDCYFDALSLGTFKSNFNKGDPWGNSFSDLAYHEIGVKNEAKKDKELETKNEAKEKVEKDNVEKEKVETDSKVEQEPEEQ